MKHYLARISARIPRFQTMEERELNYIKVLNHDSITAIGPNGGR